MPRLLALNLVWLVGMFAACATLEEAKAPAAEAAQTAKLLDCYAHALVPIVGRGAKDITERYQRATEAVAAVNSGQVTLQDLMNAAKATQADINAFVAAIEACNAQHMPPAMQREMASADAGSGA